MSVLNVRLPKEIDKAIPRKNRSAWALDAFRKKIREDRARRLGEVAAQHAEAHLAELEAWEPADAFNESIRKKARRA